MGTFLFLIFVLGVGLSLWEYAGRHLVRDIGTPSYTVLERYKEYEIREYEPFVSAEVSVSGDIETAMNDGFAILSSYLSRLDGDEVSTPGRVPDVLSDTEAGKITVAFAFPARYAEGDVPRPDDPRITFRVVPGRVAAVLRFRGTPSDRRIMAKVALLRKLLERDRHESIREEADPELVRYAPPYSMPLAVTNEVVVELS